MSKSLELLPTLLIEQTIVVSMLNACDMPAEKGKAYGTLNISLGEEPFAQRELVALSAVEEGGLFSGLVDDVKLLFE